MASSPSPLSTPANSLPEGYRLHEFEIQKVIGEGGFGIVYLAYDHQLDRMLAIKEYMPVSLAKRQEDNSITLRDERHRRSFNIGLDSFEKEARLLAQFSHPSLLHVFRFWSDNGTSYMAIQYYSGVTLKKYRADFPEKVSEAWLKTLLPPLLGAIETLHQSKYMHLDIALDNIMLQNSGVPVLLDFGSAKKAISNLDEQTEIILKPGYAPIEQYSENHNEQGSWTDIYALGAVLHALITGSPPPVSVVRCVDDTYVPLTERNLPGYSHQFLNAIDMTLKVNFNQRTQTIRELADNMGITPASVGDIIVTPKTTIHTHTFSQPVAQQSRPLANFFGKLKKIGSGFQQKQRHQKTPKVSSPLPTSNKPKAIKRTELTASAPPPSIAQRVIHRFQRRSRLLEIGAALIAIAVLASYLLIQPPSKAAPPLPKTATVAPVADAILYVNLDSQDQLSIDNMPIKGEITDGIARISVHSGQTYLLDIIQGNNQNSYTIKIDNPGIWLINSPNKHP